MDFALRELPLDLDSSRLQIETFLARFDLKYEELEYYVGLFDNETMVAGGGYYNNIIKCVAVDESLRSYGLTNKLVSHLYTSLRNRGHHNIFIYTKPNNLEVFQSLGFNPVGKAAGAILLESDRRGLPDYLNNLRKYQHPGKNGAIVVNCNPFTLGHQYLIEQASVCCARLHIFVVQEDRSTFPFKNRYELVRKGTAHLPNVLVHMGGDYIISSATFPTYFLKKYSDIIETHAELDIDIFSRHIAPALNISMRFAGEEPSDPVTATYNSTMARILPAHGIDFDKIPRICAQGEAISASRVRKLIASGQIGMVKKLVPDTTWNYLISDAAQPVMNHLIEIEKQKWHQA